MSGLGAQGFVEGLQGGIAARDSMDRNKQYKQMRKIGIAEGELDLAGRRDKGMATAMENLGDDFSQEDFDAEWGEFEQDKDPALMRFGKFLGGKIKGFFGGGGEEQASTAQMAIATPSVEDPAIGRKGIGGRADGGIIPRQRFEDGGIAERNRNLTAEERRQRSYGEHYLTEDEANERVVGPGSGMSGAKYRRGVAGPQAIPTSGGGIQEFGGDLARSASEFFPNTRRSALEGDKEVSESFDRMRNAESAQEAGGAFTDWARDSARAGSATALGIVDDTVGKVARPVGGFLAGMVGFDGKAGEGIPDEQQSPEGEAIAANVNNPEASDEQIAQGAIKEASQAALENFDYKLLVDQGVRPEDLPSMSTKDWSDYRYRMTMGSMKQGMSAVDAHNEVDQRITDSQMKGWAREGQKAMKYLMSGQNREAAMALRQAYQYFPNGTSVKFGTAVDPKTGQPAIITMGTNEETGEPTGSPMLITTERLSTMMEQMSNPAAFRTWTQDGREMQLKINQLQSQHEYRKDSSDISAYQAETDRAYKMAGGSRSGGPSSSSNLASAKWYTQQMQEKGFMEKELAEKPRLLEALVGAMVRLEMAGEHQGIALERVMDAYSNGGTDGVQQLLQESQGG
jgi:hypothetical protein